MHVCRYLNNLSKKNLSNGKSFKGVSKTFKKKHEEIEFLPPFTGCGKVLGKMPAG